MAKNRLLTAVRRIGGALALCALAGSFVTLSGTAGAGEGRKLALVIGNDAYENQPALAKAAVVEQRLRATGMNVLINEVDEHYDWDGDLDYEAKDTEIVSLVKELISDLYVMDLAITETRSIPNITITPRE